MKTQVFSSQLLKHLYGRHMPQVIYQKAFFCLRAMGGLEDVSLLDAHV